MTEEQAWLLVERDEPREWIVFLDGGYFTREKTTLEDLAHQARSWLTESMVWGMEFGRRTARLVARCETTAERIALTIETTVTPDMGESTMA